MTKLKVDEGKDVEKIDLKESIETSTTKDPFEIDVEKFTYLYSRPSKPKPRPMYKDSIENEEDEEEDEPRITSVGGINLDSLYSKAKNNIKSLYKSFLDSGNILYLYRIIIIQFSRYLENARGFKPDKSSAISVERVKRDVRDLEIEFVGMGLNLTSEISDKIEDFVKSIMLDPYVKNVSKLHYLEVVSLEMLKNLLTTCIKKGVIIDEDITKLISTNVFKDYENSVELVYIKSKNLLLYTNIHQNYSDSLKQISILGNYLNTLESKINSSKLSDEDCVIIDGVKYSKKAFESITETKLEDFIANLEIEALLDVYEDKSGDEGEIKLL